MTYIRDKFSEFSSKINISNIGSIDSRHKKTLNLVLLGVTALSILAQTVYFIFHLSNPASDPTAVKNLYLSFYVYILSIFIIYFINLRKPSTLACTLLLVQLTFTIMISGLPLDIIEGRSLVLFTLPIITSSLLLFPWASFLFAGLSSFLITIIAMRIQIALDVGAISSFFIIALVSWLLSKTQRQALEKLNSINLDLDKKVEERTSELQKANTRLKNLSEMKTRFVSTATHELRTPLTSMQGYLELTMCESVSPKVSKYLEIITRNTERLATLTDDLLDQQRIEEGRLEIKRSPIILNKLILEVIDEIKPLLEESSHILHFSITDEIIIVHGDRLRLTQVINILENAINYSPIGTTIQLLVEMKADIVEVSIIDEGIGLTKEDLNELFKPFPNIDRPVSTSQSVGLGLSISKGIIDLHEGNITAESDGTCKGSTFRFSLPVKASKEPHDAIYLNQTIPYRSSLSSFHNKAIHLDKN